MTHLLSIINTVPLMNITVALHGQRFPPPPPAVNTVVNILSQLPSVTITTVRDLFCN